MDSALSMLRLYSVLAVFLALTISLFAGQISAAAAQGAADAAAVAVTDSVAPDWDCTEAGLPADATAVAANAVVERTEQLAAVQATSLVVKTDAACSVIVSVEVAARGWLEGRTSLGVACRRPAGAVGVGRAIPIPPAC